MRFMETPPKVDTKSAIGFISSILVLLAFMPVRFIVEVCKKSVFLSKDMIEKILFNSILIGIGTTVIIMLYQLFTRKFNLIVGKMPIIIMIAGCILLTAIYFVFITSKLLVYEKTSVICEQFTGSGTNLTEGLIDDFELDTTHLEQSTILQPIDVSKENITFVDSYTAPQNPEIAYDEELQEYGDRLLFGIENMPSTASCANFTEAEVLAIQQKLENVQENTIVSKLVNTFSMQLKDNDAMTISEDIQEIPEDFVLFG